MNLLLDATLLAVLVAMFAVLCRALIGPSVYDRIVAINSFGTKTVIFIAVYGFVTERPEFLDLALVYALINFIGTIAVLKFMHYRDLGWQAGDDEEPLA